MKLHHILPLLSLSAISAFSSHQSQAASEIRPCDIETCNSESTRITAARAFGRSEGVGVHKLFFFNTETLALHSYRIVSEIDYETQHNFVRANAYNPSNEFKDYVKAVYNLEKDIYGALGITTPFTMDRQGSTGSLVYSGVYSTVFGLPAAGLSMGNFGSTSWGSTLNASVVNALANLTGMNSSQLEAALSQSVMQIQQQAGLQSEVSGNVGILSSQLSGNFANQKTYNVLAPVVKIAFVDGFAQLKWSPEPNSFEIDKVIDAEGNIFKINSDGSLSIEGVPNLVYISDANRIILEIIANRFNMSRLRAALNSGRTGNVTICEGGPCSKKNK